MYQEKCLSTKLIKQSDWSMVSSNEHMNHGRVRPELDRTKISKQAYSHCNALRRVYILHAYIFAEKLERSASKIVTFTNR